MEEKAVTRLSFQISLAALIALVVIASCLLGIAVKVYKWREAKNTEGRRRSTEGQLHRVVIALVNYKQEWGVMPGWDPAISPVNEFNASCAQKNAAAETRSDQNRMLTFLISGHYLDYFQFRQTTDDWGGPIVARFLRLPETQPDGSVKVVERFFVWSYGEDGINGVDATPDYKNLGAPDYDKEEVERIEYSLKDRGDDIVITYP